MAPPRTKPQPEDSRSEASSTKEKAGANPVNGKSRRGAGTAAGGSSLRDAVSAGPSGTSGGTMTSAQPDTAPGVSATLHPAADWKSLILHDSFNGLPLTLPSSADIDMTMV